MKKVLKPMWSDEEVAAAARAFDRWSAFFAGRVEGAADAAPHAPLSTQDARIADVLARHEAALLRRRNVVAVAAGFRTRGGVPTDERCLVVYVRRKVPARQLAAVDRLPRQIERVPIDVVEIGPVEAQAV